MRKPNGVDFWRGIALLVIFIDHVPGNVLAPWTPGNFALSDAAELFVFLAGWSLFLATGRAGRRDTVGKLFLRLLARAIDVYQAQLVITAIALAMLAAASLYLDDQLFFDWLNAGPAFSNPVQSTLGWVSLSFQLGFFNILPLYVVLLLAGPFMIIMFRVSPAATVLASSLVWVAALFTRTNLPTWPDQGEWYFNPLSWQFIFILGYAASNAAERNVFTSRFLIRALLPSLVLVSAGLVVQIWDIRVPPDRPLYLRLFLGYDKTYLPPLRVLNFLGLIVVFGSLQRWSAEWKGSPLHVISALGRHSLAVFSIASLLSLAGQIARFFADGALWADLVIVFVGTVCMFATAAFADWRVAAKSQRRAGSLPPQSSPS